MNAALFVSAFAAFFALVFLWGFRALPSEGWQILATVPVRKEEAGGWRGLNFTYYGVFNATACAFSVATLLVLTASISVPLVLAITVVATLLIACLPAARIIARIIERKQNTFTVAGASLLGFLILPLAIGLSNVLLAPRFETRIPLVPFLAAAAIAYAFGEGLGRLACISFGCCYGRSLTKCHPTLQRIFSRYHFVFTGETKKVAYEGDLIGLPIIPIQAVTAIVSTIAGLVGLWFFLRGHWALATLITVVVTQSWRFASEFLRADYRGGGRISAYQFMALGVLPYSFVMLLAVPEAGTLEPDIRSGVLILTNAWFILSLQLIWIAVFLYFGRSTVTSSRLSFHIERKRI